MAAPLNSTPAHALIDAFSIHLVYDAIFMHLSPGDRLRCRRSCRLLRFAVEDFHQRLYNINRWLTRFFTDPVAFRNVQARLSVLISGSSALQFLQGTTYPGSDLDLYVFQTDAQELGHWLLDHENYVFAPSSWQDPTFDNQDWTRISANTLTEFAPQPTAVDQFHAQHYRFYAVSAVFTFKKQTIGRHGEVHEQKVQVISTNRCPLWTVLNFHSTAVMNFVTYEGAYSLYPRATFKERSSLLFSVISSQDSAALAKYAERGWKMPAEIFAHRRGEAAPFYPGTIRWVNDQYSWVVPLDVTGLQVRRKQSHTSDVISFDPVICNSWRLRMTSNNPNHDGGMPTCTMVTNHTPRTPIFQHTYLVADRRLLRYLLRFIELQGNVEDMKAAARPPESRNEVWTWWDAEIKYIMDRYREDPHWLLPHNEQNAMEVD